MNKFKFSLAAVAVSLFFFSCNRIEQQESALVNEHVFSVSGLLPEIEQESESKGYLGSFISANWTKDDRVSVVNMTSGKILGGYLSADRSGISATFAGTVTGTINAGDVISLIYPCFENMEETDFGSRNVSIAEQSKDAKVPLVAYSKFTADKSDGTFSGISLDFRYIISYLKLNLANLPASANISKVELHNIPNRLSLSVNNAGDGFDVAADGEQPAVGKIDVSGSFTTSATGAMSVSVGVMPSEASTTRSILVTADGHGDYLSPISSAQLLSHKYYNTVASQFELISLPGKSDYGFYDIATSSVVDSYDEFASNVISGVKGNESDFTLLNLSSLCFWTIKGIPSDAKEGTTFTARVYSSGLDCPANAEFENAKVCLVEADGDFSKLWIKAGNNVFIVRK